MGEPKDTLMEKFWVFDKADGLDLDQDIICGTMHYKEIKQDLWFQPGKLMWRNNQIIFNDNLKFIKNDIHNLFKLGILQYT